MMKLRSHVSESKLASKESCTLEPVVGFSTIWQPKDCELMPWSAKAQDLLQNQYAAVGAAARQAVPAVVSSLQKAASRLESADAVASIERLLSRFSTTGNNVEKFTDAYRQYCWPVNSIEDLRLAPFHILATQNSVHVDRDHLWHMAEIAKFCKADPSELFFATRYLQVDLSDPASVEGGETWWRELTSVGGEGMVVKPLDFISMTKPTKGRSDVCQPAVKVRGSEYLRIIYGPDYDSQENLSRLRQRHLGRKRSLAIREFSLGVEGLERFVAKDPLRKVHECVFGVLALESEPVDPRL
jgi:protein phosphatase